MSTTGAIVRLSYANVFEPKETQSGEMKYSVCCLIPKTDTKSIEVIRAEVQRAIDKGIAKKTFNEAAVKSSKFRSFLRDGDEYFAENPDPQNETFKGNMFFNVANKDPIGIVDERCNPIIGKDYDKIYSGLWARVDCALYAYNQKGNIGVGGAINNIMRVRDDERLDGRQNAQAAFAAFAQTEDNSDLQ